MRPHLDCGDVAFDPVFNNSFYKRLQSIQYNAALTVTGATRGESHINFYTQCVIMTLAGG